MHDIMCDGYCAIEQNGITIDKAIGEIKSMLHKNKKDIIVTDGV